MKISKNAKQIKNTEDISYQIALYQFNIKYKTKYKNTKAWKIFKKKYIDKWKKIYLKNEYFYDEELKFYNVKYEG